MENYIGIIISLIVLVFYSFFLIYLVNIKSMFRKGTSLGFGFLVAAGFILVALRVFDVLSNSQIFSFKIPYFHESLVLLVSVLLFFGVRTLRRNIITIEEDFNKNKIKNLKKK